MDPLVQIGWAPLRQAIEEALGGSRKRVPLAALYFDDDHAVLARISVTDVAFLLRVA